jgi:putative transposase
MDRAEPLRVPWLRLAGRLWAFTVSKSREAKVMEYIRKQRDHHRVKTFQEECRASLYRRHIAFSEHYLWD